MLKYRNGIWAGGRQFKCAEGQRLVVDSAPWALYLLPVSPCGKYQGIRLYLDLKKARKNVWFLTRFVGTGRLASNWDLKVLQEFYPGMEDWIKQALAGNVTDPPVHRDNGRSAQDAFIVPYKPISQDALQKILDAVDNYWENNVPLSIAPQTRNSGRYAPDVLSPILGLSPVTIRDALKRAVADGVVLIIEYDKRYHLKGLQTAQRVQAREEGWRQFVAAGLAGPQKKAPADA